MLNLLKIVLNIYQKNQAMIHDNYYNIYFLLCATKIILKLIIMFK